MLLFSFLMIIGLTGTNASGKDSVASYLEQKSFRHYSLSDILRDRLTQEGRESSRENLIAIGNKLRQEHGPSVLAEFTLEKINSTKGYVHFVVSSIRNPAEVSSLRRHKGFVLVAVDAPLEIRYKRLLSRSRLGEGVSNVDDFRKYEERENSFDPSAQQISSCIALADYTAVNDSDFSSLHKKVDVILRQCGQTPARPSWDAYFMGIAQQVSLRSNCMKRNVAAIIVKDRRIISTGYNGTPRGVKNCNEGGCPRCNGYAEGGTKLDECLCSHGEENAIVQAAYHGVNINGSVLYTTFSPCLWCAKMVINSGIGKVIYNTNYPLGETAKKMLEEAGVELQFYSFD